MKLVRLVGGKPEPVRETEFTMSADGAEILLKCYCGAAWTVQVPPMGKRMESFCPRGCGGGVDIDRRPTLDLIPPVESLQDTLKDLTYQTPEALRKLAQPGIFPERFERPPSPMEGSARPVKRET